MAIWCNLQEKNNSNDISNQVTLILQKIVYKITD
jgi:hypothetical protein